MKSPRIPDLTPAEFTDRQKKLFDEIAGPRGGVVRGPFAIWLRHPELVEKANEFGSHLRMGTSVPRHLSELAILVTAHFWSASYEWCAHAEAAAKAGISSEIIEAIRTGKNPYFEDEVEQIVYTLATELYETHFISDTVYEQAIELMGQELIIDLIAILGFYTMVALTLNGFHAPVPDGTSDPFSE